MHMPRSALLALAALPAAAAAGSATPPHILAVLADDFGWANVGFHHSGGGGGGNEVATPVIDGLVSGGVELLRHYTFRICSPSRSSFQSGRLPVHVNDVNAEPTVPGAGIAENMTCIAEKLRSAGYRTHMTGKWDCGMATPQHTPTGRGYESWLGYFHHANDYYTEELGSLFSGSTGTVDICGNKYVDLWDTDRPAHGRNGTGYEEELFTNHSLAVIAAHAPSEPLFLVHAFHIVHTPLQVPQEYVDKFSFIDQKQRQLYAAMVNYMDGVVGRLVAALEGKGMWASTLMVFTSDNGGPIYNPAGANNFPLKGGKYSDWEGGVRTNAFVAGGALPSEARGTQVDALVHIADWYATFAGIAGAGAADAAAAAAGLPGVDGVDQWPVISGAAATGPRSEIHLSSQALIQGRLKLVVGDQLMTGWTGPSYPNATGDKPNFPGIFPVGLWNASCGGGCLFDIFADPAEHADLAPAQPAAAARLAARLAELNRAAYKPDRGAESAAACAAAEQKYGGFYGPYVGV